MPFGSKKPCYKHPEPMTYDDEFELLLSRSKFFKNYFVVLIEVLCCNFYKLPKFLPFYKRKVEKSKGGNQKNFLSILKASIIKKQDFSKTIVCFFMKGLVFGSKFQLRPDRDIWKINISLTWIEKHRVKSPAPGGIYARCAWQEPYIFVWVNNYPCCKDAPLSLYEISIFKGTACEESDLLRVG